jgi:tetratricopeptide (TPR) repeat protein
VRARINLGNAFFQHGVAYFRLGKKDQGVAEMDRAAAEYRTVLESSTSEHRGAQLIAVNNLAAVFVVTGRPEEAIQLFTSLPQTSTEGQAQALDRLAADFAAVGKFPEAIRTAQKAMQLAAAAKNTTLEHQIQEELEIYQDKQSQGKKPPRK